MYTQADPVFAGFWRRAAAFLIDLALALLLSVPLRLLLAFLGIFGIGRQPVFFHYTPADLLLTGAVILYFCVFEGALGTTPGKRMLRMRVVCTRTGYLGWKDAIYRETVGRFLNSLLFIGYLMAGADREKRTWADRLCDTRVLLLPKKGAPATGGAAQTAPAGLSAAPPVPPPPAPVPAAPLREGYGDLSAPSVPQPEGPEDGTDAVPPSPVPDPAPADSPQDSAEQGDACASSAPVWPPQSAPPSGVLAETPAPRIPPAAFPPPEHIEGFSTPSIDGLS
ncbi:RDD family protein [Anaerofilum sp. BX8]|uniref:RDD family protein n=1 Tax=Anaerofilum hominis TaxID=2763016 RepID=A0A923L149_9FIRM|nr:RDD family protein [Anaerofilum hominis]MBC5580658.1 RDD family protein [Anaerofilum hominis]